VGAPKCKAKKVREREEKIVQKSERAEREFCDFPSLCRTMVKIKSRFQT
jgi:hypothetical protein